MHAFLLCLVVIIALSKCVARRTLVKKKQPNIHNTASERYNSHNTQRAMLPLHWAAYYGDEAIRNKLIQRGVSINELDKQGVSALHWAAAQGDATIVRTLIRHGARVNRPNKRGDTPLHLAVKERHIDCVAMLRQCGARQDIKNKDLKQLLT